MRRTWGPPAPGAIGASARGEAPGLERSARIYLDGVWWHREGGGEHASQAERDALRRWVRLTVRVVRQMDRDNLVIIAAGLAFFALLSGTPILVAIVSVYALAADPAGVERQINVLAEILPEAVRQVIAEQLREIVRASSTGVGLAAVLGGAAALWAGSKGVFYMFRALDVAYGVRQPRGFVRLKVLAFAYTLGFIALAAVALGGGGGAAGPAGGPAAGARLRAPPRRRALAGAGVGGAVRARAAVPPRAGSEGGRGAGGSAPTPWS